MVESGSRWALPDLHSAIAWCSQRNATNIRCVLDVLGEYARNERQTADSVQSYLAAAEAISDNQLDASLTVKLSALGVLFDTVGCRNNALTIEQAAARRGVGFEIDMEGKGLVSVTLDVAQACAARERRVTLALQAYLNRTSDDLERIVQFDITPRIVKGAYVGSTSDFVEIQMRFKELVGVLGSHKAFFAVGTHDPGLVEWIKMQMDARKELIEFGFLKGLSDRTKIAMAEDGWRVSEYVPFGENLGAYESRRQKYLTQLQALGRSPLP
ncbi:MAG TPA: proline dehydrogenase family protein [Candidatus Bathyarchaeia archaeon]|nr:proline dehydrogenase family protein [Candidatus Bathyarchaeia archaeon]